MKEGHEFPAEHGFTGSAMPKTNFKPVLPGMRAIAANSTPKKKMFKNFKED